MYKIEVQFLPLVAVVLLTVLLSAPVVHATGPGSILINNVHLIARDNIAKDIVVNILISNTSLEVVTRDSIASETVEISLDASSMDGDSQEITSRIVLILD